MPKHTRAYWKGHLRLSLVSLPIEIYSAVESQAEVHFNEIHKPSGRRVGRKRYVEGVGEVQSSDIAKGVEVAPDEYVLVDQAEIDAAKPESSKTLDLLQFIDQSEIDYRYFERPYFLVPADKLAAEGYAVIRDALRKTGKVGLGEVTISNRTWVVSVSPLQDGLVMEMLRFADELKKPEDYFDDVPAEKPQKEMIDLAVQLIGQKTAPYRPEKFENVYQEKLRALVEAKRKGKKIISHVEAPRRVGGNVVNLMDALRKSIEGKEKAKPKVKTAKGKKSA
ncbi:Ku protein [Hyphomicrobium sp. DY-1]|uniref:non-homologous end joining protein Ku n=1 Tax=Hyphomicrobium sp. DY-1 TaxID=3075650 RepID=UPI0039C1A575